MTGKAIRHYHMLVRVSRFGAEHATSFPSETVGPRTFADVQAAADALRQHALAQASARVRDKVHVKSAARKRLRDTLRAIGRTARALAIDSPGLDLKFRVPKTNGDHALLTAARAVRRDAREFASEFIAHGLPPTFLDDLAEDIRAVDQAGTDYNAVKQAGVAATAGVHAALARGFASVRRLDAIVANVFRDDTPALAVWQLARRVGRGRRSAAPASDEAVAPIRLVTNVA
jgi:hypothetical protein